MSFTLTGKIVTLCVVLAVTGGLTATIVLFVKDNNNDNVDEPPVETTTDSTTDFTTDSTTDFVDSGVLYDIGVGIADMTGPCVEIVFMGYAEPTLTGKGIHLRQFSRAFIFKRGESRVVVVTAEVQAVGYYVRKEVVRNLQALYGDIYKMENVLISGTHTHSAPGGHLVEFLLDVSILGFSQETFDAYVDGITRSIVRAHESMAPARLFIGQTRVWGAHVNRSPYSYEFNPPEERARYDRNTDNTLTQIRIESPDGDLRGVMNWFAVHAVSMNMTNHLVSSDNLGIAALMMEKELNPTDPAGKPSKTVAGFFAANIGDVSPNTATPTCEFSGRECDNHFTLCEAGERCYAGGAGKDMVESATIVATLIFEGAMEVLSSPGEELRGDVGVAHQFVEMSEQQVPRYDPVAQQFVQSEQVKSCVPAMGYSFAAGTTDGANTLNITQGMIEGIPLLDDISGLIAEPTEEDIECHAPKPILLATGRANFPLPWQPRVVSVAAALLGGALLAAVPGEPTTTAGRRARALAHQEMEKVGLKPWVIVGGLTNEYISYVATFEEYQVQRYEGASTIYGPHTLDVLLNKYSELISALLQGVPVPPGPTPHDYMNQTLSLITPVLLDSAGLANFGDCIQQPETNVAPGDIIYAVFVAANPRNDLKQESSHAVVQRLEMGEWIDIANDADLSTRFHWERTSSVLGRSEARFEWEVPNTITSAPHRIVYYGVSKSLLGTLTPFTGVSDSFYITTINSSY